MAGWQLVLRGRFRLLDKFREFVAGSQQGRVVTEDTWQQVGSTPAGMPVLAVARLHAQWLWARANVLRGILVAAGPTMAWTIAGGRHPSLVSCAARASLMIASLILSDSAARWCAPD